MRTRLWIRCFVLASIHALAIVLLAVGPGPAHAQGKYTKEDIVKAWRERQERVKSAKFEWAEQWTETRGSLSYYWKSFDPKLKEVIPPEDVTFTDPRAVSLEGSKFRYAYTRR